ncbi:MAG: DNA polymerase III subunit delta [Parcubacteria group bacterium Gr01-1014_38]|nr:MAG: DNA polymerase III subunit delta [Parcubacteria group bacterium Gr01-1014_38]
MVTVFYGEDTYRSREAYRTAREAAREHADVPVVVLRDERLTPAALHAALGGETLFGARPPVAVERLTSFTGASATAIASVLRAAPQDAIVLVWEEGVPAGNGIVWRALQALADLQHFPLPSEPEVLTWLVQRAAASGRTIDAAARRALVARCGANLWLLASELDKLILIQPVGSITAADVERVTASTPAVEIFTVVRAIVHGQAREALRSLAAGTLAGEDPRRIFFLVLRELEVLLRVRERLDQEESPTEWELAREFHLPKSAAEHLLRTARQTTTPPLRALFDRGVVAYYHLNTGRAEAGEVLERLALEGMQGRQA